MAAKKKTKTGRPTDYGPHIVEQAKAYLKTREDMEIETGTEDRPRYVLKVKLVVLSKLHDHYPDSVQPHLISLESFIAEVRVLKL